MNSTVDLGKLGAGLLLDARATKAGDIGKLDRFFAQFADDHMRGAEHRIVTVAPRVYLVLVDPAHASTAATLGADLARSVDHMGSGKLEHRFFILPGERKALSEAIADLRSEPEVDPVEAVSDGSSRLGSVLSGLDLSNFTRERAVYSIDGRQDAVRFYDLEIDLASVGENVGIEISGNPFLAEYASTLIERRVLRDLPNSTRTRLAPICVHFHSRFAASEFFEKSVAALPISAKNRLVLDFSAGDVLSNEKRVGAFFGDLRSAGISIAVSQIDWQKAEALAPYSGRISWFKGKFAKEDPIGHGLLVLGAARCIAEGLGTLAEAQDAVAAGARNISGPGADAFIAARASAAARAGNTGNQK